MRMIKNEPILVTTQMLYIKGEDYKQCAYVPQITLNISQNYKDRELIGWYNLTRSGKDKMSRLAILIRKQYLRCSSS